MLLRGRSSLVLSYFAKTRRILCPPQRRPWVSKLVIMQSPPDPLLLGALPEEIPGKPVEAYSGNENYH
jgi:hypothetical protein